ncbi:multidrug ABC transporter substrate-binding protein [Flavobacterium psychrophilum]|nr:multidrug ABC transporter substrate-binding protein [Flavobacterium psychrophilum]AOE52631.1 multidrug ABC transporter substrate-binding protein [Flavobacterium psychrophilum]
MLNNWLKIYLYQIKNNKFFTALNVLGLSLGIAGLVFSILYWNDEHAYNSWNPEKDRVFYSVIDMGENKLWGASAAPVGPHLTSIPEVTEYCYMNAWYNNAVLEYKGKKEMIGKVTDAQKNFFSFFPFEFIQGNAKTALDEGSIALSETTAKRLFGSQAPMGEQVRYGEKLLTVKGIYRLDGKSSFQPDIVTNGIDPKLKENESRWGAFSFAMLVKLKNADDAAAVEQKIEKLYYDNATKLYAAENGISPQEYINRYGDTRVHLESLADLRLHSRVRDVPEGRGNYQFLMIMLGLSLLILLLSIVNYINLATANAIKRAKEVGVRKILGATKSNIIKQFVFETVLTTLFALLLAMVIVEISLPYYNMFLGKELVIESSQFYIQLIVVFIVIVLLSGILPAVYVSKFESINVLKGNFSRSKRGIWLRNGMLVLQFGIASFFIIGSYIVNQQVNYLASKDVGFKGDQVIDIAYRNSYDFKDEKFREKLAQKYSSVKQRLLAIKGVQKVSGGTFKLGGGSSHSSSFTYGDAEVSLQYMVTDFGLLDMMKIKMAQGRDLSPRFASDTINSVLINETAMKMFGDKQLVGKFIKWDKDDYKVVGVVKDFHLNNPQDPIPPMVFAHQKAMNWMMQNTNDIYVTVDPTHMESALAEMEQLWHSIDPDYPFSYDFVDKYFARSYQSYVHQRNLFTLLNIVVMLIALFGLFALSSYSIQRRMKEIAIRKTLGAETGVLLTALSKQYIVFCIVGFAIALFPAWLLLDKWLENFTYRIDISVLPFLAGFIVLMVLTLIVVISRAWHATRMDVLTYLKYE